MFADSGKVDYEGKYSIFGQIIQHLLRNQPDMRNFCQRDANAKAFEMKFLGEGSIDAGGPFREAFSNIGSELMSPVLPLLIKSPNNRNDYGSYRDCYILNPAPTTPSTETMYKMLGGFLGFSFLTKQPLPINLAPFVWKQILEEDLTLADLDDIDSYSVQVLKELQMYGPSLSDEEFEMQGQVFRTVLSNGEEVDLVEGGESKPVTKADLREFVDLTLKKRFTESAEAVKHIREGLKLAVNNRM